MFDQLSCCPKANASQTETRIHYEAVDLPMKGYDDDVNPSNGTMIYIRATELLDFLYDEMPAGFDCLFNSTVNVTSGTAHASKVVRVLWDFVAPVIFSVGTIGNILILVAINQKSTRGTSTSTYLTLMAIADLFVLATGMIPEWLEANHFLTWKELHPFCCKTEKFLFYTSGDTAIWIRVLFTLDRLVAVCCPLYKGNSCLPWRAKYYSLGALMAAIAKNLHVFWTRGAEYVFVEEATMLRCPDVFSNYLKNTSAEPVVGNITGVVLHLSNCGSTSAPNKYFTTFVRPWIAFSLVSVLPFITILLCNLLIIQTLVRVKRTRAEHLLVSASHDRHIIQMTTMCLSASFCFLVCVTPSIILLIGKPYWNVRGIPNPAYDVAKAVNNMLYYVVHSANFFLYCITGKRFRDALLNTCRPGRKYSSLSSSLRSSAYGASIVVKNNSMPLLTRSNGRTQNANHQKISPIEEAEEGEEAENQRRTGGVHHREAVSSQLEDKL